MTAWMWHEHHYEDDETHLFSTRELAEEYSLRRLEAENNAIRREYEGVSDLSHLDQAIPLPVSAVTVHETIPAEIVTAWRSRGSDR